MYTSVNFTSQNCWMKGVSYINLVSGLAVTLKINYYYYILSTIFSLIIIFGNILFFFNILFCNRNFTLQMVKDEIFRETLRNTIVVANNQ